MVNANWPTVNRLDFIDERLAFGNKGQFMRNENLFFRNPASVPADQHFRIEDATAERVVVRMFPKDNSAPGRIERAVVKIGYSGRGSRIVTCEFCDKYNGPQDSVVYCPHIEFICNERADRHLFKLEPDQPHLYIVPIFPAEGAYVHVTLMHIVNESRVHASMRVSDRHAPGMRYAIHLPRFVPGKFGMRDLGDAAHGALSGWLDDERVFFPGPPSDLFSPLMSNDPHTQKLREIARAVDANATPFANRLHQGVFGKSLGRAEADAWRDRDAPRFP